MTTTAPHHHVVIPIVCDACSASRPPVEVFHGPNIRPALLPYIQRYAPHWNLDSNICLECLNRARSDFVEGSLMAERGELSAAEKEVLDALRHHEPVSVHPEFFESTISFGDHLADQIAAVGGSWTFIMTFTTGLVVWIIFNSYVLASSAFDPYPYILLNLILSCLAALQAPIIMMSQNRQAAKDRLQAEADYKTNLKAELEIRHLNIKLDQLITQQWRKLLEIQQVQLDMMRDAAGKK